MATSRAWYLGVESDLYDGSPSSSMMIIPTLVTGANIALLVPITILASPRITRLNSSVRCPNDSEECITAILSPKSDLNLPSICGVRDISGTSMTAVLPISITLFISFMNTEVLPLPVTP